MNQASVNSKFLNVGCGTHYHKDWVNIDINADGSDVINFDIKKGLPFENKEFDAVYSSHMLEHLSQSDGISFLREMYRVLKPGGVIRIVVPDLEAICRKYLEKLDCVREGNESALDDYEWMRLELTDQIARDVGGGEMLRFLLRPDLKNKDFIVSRIGQEARNIWKQAHDHAPINTTRLNDKISRWSEKLKIGIMTALFGKEAERAIRIGTFRLSGETHKVMYDEYSCRAALTQAGFTGAAQTTADKSMIHNFTKYSLDTVESGEVRKPDSIFVEAVRPA
jgi:predicted SAM-dependent methyltransferase